MKSPWKSHSTPSAAPRMWQLWVRTAGIWINRLVRNVWSQYFHSTLQKTDSCNKISLPKIPDAQIYSIHHNYATKWKWYSLIFNLIFKVRNGSWTKVLFKFLLWRIIPLSWLYSLFTHCCCTCHCWIMVKWMSQNIIS